MSRNDETRNNDNFIMLPTVDFCFKELMQNPKVRTGFVAALLQIKPEEIGETELLPTILQRDSVDEKLGILDVRIKLVDGAQMDLEMQVANFKYWKERVIFYLCKMYTEQLKRGESYSELKRCVHVSILDFIHFPEDDVRYRTIKLRNDETGQLYSDMLEIQILELKKLSGEMPENDDLAMWMRFFGGKTREEFESMAKENEYIAEAYETLQKLSADEEKRLEYEAREKALKDYNTQVQSYWEDGVAEGIAKGVEDTVKLMAKELPIETISKILNKSESEILNIINKI